MVLRRPTRKVVFIQDRVSTARTWAKAIFVSIGDWSIDGLGVLRSLSFRFTHGVTSLEFAGFLSREAQVEVTEKLELMAERFLRNLTSVDLLEVQTDAECGVSIFRWTDLGRQML